VVIRREEIIGDCRLILGDCLEVLPTLGPVDAVVTDPPYGVNLGTHRGATDTRQTVLRKLGYDSYDDTPENFGLIVVPGVRAALALAERGAVWMPGCGAWQLPTPSAIGGVFLPSGMGRNSWGFASFQHCLFYGTAPDLNLGAKGTGFRSTETVEANGHPCPKPIGWMMWTVSLASRKAETILDPFMGSGTTLVACAKLGRRGIGIEIDEGYFNIACERVRKAYAQPDLFIAPPVPAKQEAMDL
jgi:site-specific DNA-methyltransferase (adenine-specific)